MLKDAITAVGGVVSAAAICDVSPRAVYKWISNGRLPRTEYTGETRYAHALAQESDGAFTAESLLERLLDVDTDRG